MYTRLAIERSGATASCVGLGTFQNNYTSLAGGKIDAGALPVDLRFLGEAEHDWHAFPSAGLGSLHSVLLPRHSRMDCEAITGRTVARVVKRAIIVATIIEDLATRKRMLEGRA